MTDSHRVEVREMGADDDPDELGRGNPLAWQFAWWRRLETEGQMETHWRVGLLDGRPAGLGCVVPLPLAAGGYAFAVLSVVPEARRHGVGTALRAAVEDLARDRVAGVLYNYAEGDAEAEGAVAAWCLAELGRHTESVLDLTSLDRERFAALAATPQADGVVLRALDEEEPLDEEAWHRLHAFVQDRFREAPDSADGGGLLPYDVFRSTVSEPWMLVAARRDGEYVGVTSVMAHPTDPTATNTFFTGVAPQARGRGLATALKARQALVMADRGVERLLTQNMEGNEPILAANRRLGFVRDGGYVDVGVRLDEA